MPGTTTTGSTNIALLDSKIVASLCDGNFYIDLTPSVWIADGDENVLGANVEILNPFGVIVKPYGSNYELSPALSGGMAGVISFPIPTQAGNYQYGTYTINVQLFDADGNSWVVTKTVKICVPDKNNKTRNYGSLSAVMNADCVVGKLFILVDGVPTYNGTLMESQVLTGTLEYPTSSALPTLAITTGNFSVTLFEGVYKLVGEICATYNYGDNVFVKVKYKIKKEYNVRCLIDRCCILAALQELQSRTETDCTDAEKELTASTIVEALNLYTMAELAGKCGEDPSEGIEKLEKLLGCKCTCNCAEGTPIIGTTPASDVVIEGCNVSSSENGLTTTYTINNYEYVVSIDPNGGALTVAPATLAGCTKTQLITFDISVVYSQIKTLANQNNTEGDFWASVVNKALRDVDPACLGITAEAWQALSLPAKFTAILTKMCACCGGCSATITNTTVTQVAGDVKITWMSDAYIVAVYLDGLFVASYLQSAADPATDLFTHIFTGAADGLVHTWILEAYCNDKTKGETETGQFQYVGCPVIAPTLLTATVVDGVVSNATCPYSLPSLVSPSNPLTAEWHTANNTLAATLVSNPGAVAGGAYWVFNKDANGCYSPGQQVTIICNATASCTAPQNLQVFRLLTCNFMVWFQSAAFPPPGNSYTVKRRLASDPDVGGSYTTIGTPVWDAGNNRWSICDSTAVSNTLYVYRAISNCGATEPSIDYDYAYLVCPTLVLYPTETTVSYSFVPIANATEMVVQILDSTGTVVIDTDTYSPVIANPRTGIFEYLTHATTYLVRLKVTFAGGASEVQYTCSSQSVTTDPAT